MSKNEYDAFLRFLSLNGLDNTIICRLSEDSNSFVMRIGNFSSIATSRSLKDLEYFKFTIPFEELDV